MISSSVNNTAVNASAVSSTAVNAPAITATAVSIPAFSNNVTAVIAANIDAAGRKGAGEHRSTGNGVAQDQASPLLPLQKRSCGKLQDTRIVTFLVMYL